jgi:HEAT repeat protein
MAQLANRARTLLKQVTTAVKRRRGIAVGVAIAIAGAGVVLAIGPGEIIEQLTPEPDLEGLKRRASAEPKNAEVQRELAHAYFAAGKRSTALKTYEKALALDKSIADDTLVGDLAACFDKPERGTALRLLGQYKVVAAESALVPLTKDKNRSARWEAVRTLEKMGRAGRIDYQWLFEQDLSNPDCATRKRAVSGLIKIGDKSSLAPIRAAVKKDDENTSFFSSACLEELGEEAEKKLGGK